MYSSVGNTADQLRELILRHIEDQGFHIVEEDPDMETRLAYPRIVKVTGGTGGSVASRTSMANPFAQSIVAAASAAADRAFGPGALVVAPGMGGTLPLHLFTEIAGTQIGGGVFDHTRRRVDDPERRVELVRQASNQL